MFEKLTETMDGFIENLGIPFYDCVVMKDGKCVYRHSNGCTDTDKKTPVTGKELYDIYSCSKLITCTAALQLYEKGKFGLDDYLYLYMPEFENMTVKDENGNIRPAQNKITVRELFTMTAGFGYDVGSPMMRKCVEDTDGECQTLTVMEYLAKEPLLFEPGYRWNYSLCHDVLAALVEKISGMTFGEYVKKNIFDVCGMENSSFLIDESNAERLVCHYSYNNRTEKVEKCPKNVHFRIGTKYESGGAGCVSCVDDYIKFLEALRTYKLLKKETVDLLSTNQMTKEQMDMPSYWVALKRGYGLGQQCPTKTNKRPDFGWGGAAGSHYFVDCRDGITAFFATQVFGYDKLQSARIAVTDIVLEAFGVEY